MNRSTREMSFAAAVGCATLAGLHLLDSALDLGLGRLMAFRTDEFDSVLSSGGPDGLRGWWSVATLWMSSCAHGGFEHLAVNLAFLWFFGALLSQLVGDRWVVLALLITPLTANLAFWWLHAGPPTMVIGASGAVSGVSGLYVLLAFRWDGPSVYAWPLARPVPPAQAALLAVLAVALDIYVMRRGGGGGVARAAHLGGFAGGILIGAFLTTFLPSYDHYRNSRWAPGGLRGA